MFYLTMAAFVFPIALGWLIARCCENSNELDIAAKEIKKDHNYE